MLPTALEIILRAARTAKRGGSLCATTAQSITQWNYAYCTGAASQDERLTHVNVCSFAIGGKLNLQRKWPNLGKISLVPLPRRSVTL